MKSLHKPIYFRCIFFNCTKKKTKISSSEYCILNEKALNNERCVLLCVKIRVLGKSPIILYL